MSDIIRIDMSQSGHLVDPPIVDFLAHEPELSSWLVEFVPDPRTSSELKEAVQIKDDSDEGRSIMEFLSHLSDALTSSGRIVRIAHAGGGDFDVSTADGVELALRGTSSTEQTFEAYKVLQALAMFVEVEFIRQRRLRTRAAG